MKGLKFIIPIIVVVAAIVYLAPRPSFVPPELWGVWVSDDERYADRHIDINESILSFGQGGVEIRVVTIERVEKKAAAGGDQYLLHYRDADGAPQRLRLHFERAGGGQLQIASQKGTIWHRETTEDGF